MGSFTGIGELNRDNMSSLSEESTVTYHSGSRCDGGGDAWKRRNANSEDESSKIVSTSSDNDLSNLNDKRMKLLGSKDEIGSSKVEMETITESGCKPAEQNTSLSSESVMKRHGSPDSLGALMSICPTTEQHSPGGNTHDYTREFQSMLEGLDEDGCCGEDSGQISEKKRRLSVDQVKALEKNFEVENKLEPERKVTLAQELGLQPRQVAVWFQNRRARWKTKQLERDYGVLKANYNSLKLNFDSLRHDNESLLKEIKELKSKLNGENDDNNDIDFSVKEEAMGSESGGEEKEKSPETGEDCDDVELNYENFSNNHGLMGERFFPDLKDGSSDSDSSAILNEENNSNGSPNGMAIQSHQFMPVVSPATIPATMNCYKFPELKSILGDAQRAYHQPQYVKIEEHNFFSGDDSCNFFSDEQAPTMPWYHDQWN